ncbi:hypothetical protein OCK74_08350 [Chitinophagaceae bacterium LB-8]|uniref:DUF4476 domain-containing protein n=1 Tax=Paraflavisolibacter caeni TaxID=2982496 RepID=A0A9X2XWS6_9BACT|nr:hypothetical protein [Paraflavisolibacter caeni]MCU7549123.1 hypothetical protein [Paraflavisolibacter caeni]
MKKIQWVVLLAFFLNTLQTTGQTASFASQTASLDRLQFFLDDRPLEMTVATDFRKMQSERKKGVYQNGSVTMNLPGIDPITEDIRLYARGEFRRQNCRMPGLMVNFKTPNSPVLSPLKKMKLTCGCGPSSNEERLLLTEYLIYKMYTLFTDMSLKVRLSKVTYRDTREKMKEYTQYGFLMEDVDDMAARNSCKEVEGKTFVTEQTNRKQMTLVAIFQYMVGNTDWSVPNYHNIKLMRSKEDSLSLPYVVPYDFDFAGMVNAYYATPTQELGIEKVTERLYRGFPRRMDELQETLDIFRNKKEEVFALVSGFELIKKNERDLMLRYLQEFYTTIENPRQVQKIFIDNARTQ